MKESSHFVSIWVGAVLTHMSCSIQAGIAVFISLGWRKVMVLRRGGALCGNVENSLPGGWCPRMSILDWECGPQSAVYRSLLSN